MPAMSTSMQMQTVTVFSEPGVDGRDTTRSLAVALAVLESAECHRPVEP